MKVKNLGRSDVIRPLDEFLGSGLHTWSKCGVSIGRTVAEQLANPDNYAIAFRRPVEDDDPDGMSLQAHEVCVHFSMGYHPSPPIDHFRAQWIGVVQKDTADTMILYALFRLNVQGIFYHKADILWCPWDFPRSHFVSEGSKFKVRVNAP